MPSNISTARLAPRLPRTNSTGTDFDANLVRLLMVSGPVMERLIDEPNASTARVLEIYEQEAELREPIIFGSICTKPELCVQNKRKLPQKQGRRMARMNGIDGPLRNIDSDDTTRAKLLKMRLRTATSNTKFIGKASVHSFLTEMRRGGAR
jgi:hypothetical protein